MCNKLNRSTTSQRKPFRGKRWLDCNADHVSEKEREREREREREGREASRERREERQKEFCFHRRGKKLKNHKQADVKPQSHRLRNSEMQIIKGRGPRLGCNCIAQAFKTLSPTGFYTLLFTALSTWRDNTHTPITEYKSIEKTPSVPPEDCDHDDDGDVSEGALPDVCVSLRFSRCEALQHNQVHFTTSAREAYTYEQRMRGTYTHWHASHIQYEADPCPKADPTKCSNLCVYEQPRHMEAHSRVK